MRVASQRIGESCTALLSRGDVATLPKDTLVKCVDKKYLPRYPEPPFGDYNESYRVAVYTQFGLALIDRSCISDWEVY